MSLYLVWRGKYSYNLGSFTSAYAMRTQSLMTGGNAFFMLMTILNEYCVHLQWIHSPNTLLNICCNTPRVRIKSCWRRNRVISYSTKITHFFESASTMNRMILNIFLKHHTNRKNLFRRTEKYLKLSWTTSQSLAIICLELGKIRVEIEINLTCFYWRICHLLPC